MRMRSVLFTPGTRPERVTKALETGAADVVVADLEDAVAPGDKIEARIAVRNALLEAAGDKAKAVRAVRINPWPSSLAEEDLDVVMVAAPDLIVVPKAEDAATLAVLDQRLEQAEAAQGIAPGTTRLLLIAETAAGVLDARELTRASDRVVGIAFGAEDLAADAGMRRSPSNDEVAVARSMVALAAAASRVAAIDMITADMGDLERLEREASEARSLGFAGKMCIHPKQVPVVHAAFDPTEDELAWAQKVVAAAEEGGASDGGVVVVDGRMIDVPLIEQARRVLQAQA